MLTRSGEAAGGVPSGNLLLRRLRAEDRGALLPHLRQVALGRGTMVLRAAEPIERVLFPETGLLALEESVGHSRVEVAVVGREGLVGWPALLGCGHSDCDAVVQCESGQALAIAVEPLLAACRASMALWTSLLGFVQAIMQQMARTIATQKECSLEQRIARWILMRHDRIRGDQVVIRHDQIGDALNVRRASITDRLQILEGRGLIRCRRGRIIVRDRVMLGLSAGDTYERLELKA